MIIIYDTETVNQKANSAGVLPASLADLEMQPTVIEIAAIKLNEDLEEVDRFDHLVDPCMTIPEETTKITNITNDMIVGKPTYAALFPQLVDFFLGVKTQVAHNINYDTQVLIRENKRLEKEHHFPYPPVVVDTVRMSQQLSDGKRLKLTDMHKLLFGEPFKNAHRAMADVEALTKCYRELKKRGF